MLLTCMGRRPEAVEEVVCMSKPCAPLLHINWNLSYACRFDCAHCYSRDRADGTGELDLENKLLVADNIVRSGVFDVNMGGGEPLDCPDLDEVSRRLAEGNVSVSICTNGWGAGPEDAKRLLDCGVGRVYISLDGACASTHDALRRHPGAFDSAVAAIDVYRGAGLQVGISATITRVNFDELHGIAMLAEMHGAAGVEFKRLKLQGNAAGRHDLELSPEQEEELIGAFPEMRGSVSIPISLIYGHDGIDGVDEGCPCGKSVLAIMADGAVCPCVYSRMPLGNATVDAIDSIWSSSPELDRFRNSGMCPGLGLEP